jgi:hypothetical protein
MLPAHGWTGLMGVEADGVASIAEVVFASERRDELIDHGRRKLAGVWRPDEEQAPKAYGLIGARIAERRALVTHVIPLRKNLRDRDDFKTDVDRLMDELAVPSETPMDRRGWVADPREVLAAERRCEADGSLLFGSYHMHRVAWSHDPHRDTCTALDRSLAQESGLWAFILSLVDPERPILRAFFEGDNTREATICVEQGVSRR